MTTSESIELFLAYAKGQGSRNADFYRMNIRQCINKRNIIAPDVFVPTIIKDGIKRRLNYKVIYTMIKDEAIKLAMPEPQIALFA